MQLLIKAKITSCIIKVHYQCGDGLFDQHAIPPVDPPLPDTLCIELAFINALCFMLFHIMLLSVTLQRQRSLPHQLLSWTRAKRRGDNHWHSILCRGDSINLVLLLHPFFFNFLHFFCCWISNVKVFPILDEYYCSINPWAGLLDRFLNKSIGLEVTENILCACFFGKFVRIWKRHVWN